MVPRFAIQYYLKLTSFEFIDLLKYCLELVILSNKAGMLSKRFFLKKRMKRIFWLQLNRAVLILTNFMFCDSRYHSSKSPDLKKLASLIPYLKMWLQSIKIRSALLKKKIHSTKSISRITKRIHDNSPGQK